MPLKRELYPDDWEDISHRIRFERAGGKCEQCGVRHGETIVRQPDTPHYLIYDLDTGGYLEPDGTPIRLSELPEEFQFDRLTKVVLTVHHIGVDKPDGSPGSPHDKMDCRDENLIALCQRCHLLADQPHHVQASKRTKLKNKHAAKQATGQKTLFEVLS